MAELIDTFRGDNQELIASINALLHLDSTNSLVPHGIGGHARVLLASAAVRLAAPPAQAVSVPEGLLDFLRVEATSSSGLIYYPARRLRELLSAAPAAATREGKE